MKHRKELQKLLAEKKLKKTSQRALIWAALLESKGHPSVEEIRDILLGQGHRIGLATIYRTIKILLESGFVRQSKLHGFTRYEPVIKQPNHLRSSFPRGGSRTSSSVRLKKTNSRNDTAAMPYSASVRHAFGNRKKPRA
jgi:Ferric uptake regulator family